VSAPPEIGQRTALLVPLAAMAWAGNALYALAAPEGMVKLISPGIVALALLTYVFGHGALRYGRAAMMRFVVTVFAVGWAFETLSIATGFPFGRYHYTDLMAPFLGHVPVFVLPAYLVIGYASWSLAKLLLYGRSTVPAPPGLWRVPVLAALLMVMWDLSMDPLRATVEGRWVWAGGGVHLGVPVTNYLGWFVVTWTMFQCFAFYLARCRPAAPAGLSGDRGFWVSIPLAYAAFAGEYLLNPFTGHGDAVAAASEAGGAVQDIFATVAAIALLTLIPAMAAGLYAALGPYRRGRARALQPSSARARRRGRS